jgi:hypothetical protein
MSDAEIAELRGRLARLEDLESARGLLHTYATVLDEPREETVTALFAEDGVLTNARGTFRGRDEIAKGFRLSWDADPSRKRHLVGTPRLTWVGPGVVESQAAFLFVGRGDESIIGWGEYDDRILVDGDRALFLAKTITTHLKTDLATGWAAG